MKNSRKIKGTAAERELLHKFWSVGWACLRAAGSGSMKYPCVDLLAGNKVRKLAIECKTSKALIKYMSKDDIYQLQKFSSLFGAEPWIAVKFDKKEWFFITIEDLRPCGNNFAIDMEAVKSRGLLFEEVIKNKEY
ncbi:MAG: Holliday junction resolvase Hjc [Nanoarchaeota archaeon]|nr:Holliday junction resolvase Hjc [Nanoarchaeota archaeon]